VSTIGNVHFFRSLGAAEKHTFLLFHTNVAAFNPQEIPDLLLAELRPLCSKIYH
jgi:hypothetical protein